MRSKGLRILPKSNLDHISPQFDADTDTMPDQFRILIVRHSRSAGIQHRQHRYAKRMRPLPHRGQIRQHLSLKAVADIHMDGNSVRSAAKRLIHRADPGFAVRRLGIARPA